MFKWEFDNDQNIELFTAAIDNMWNNPSLLDSAFGMNLGHTDQHIGNDPDENLFTRIVEDEIAGEGRFQDKESANDFIMNALCVTSDQIIAWLQGAQGHFDSHNVIGNSTSQELVITVNMQEKVGTSYLIKQKLENDKGEIFQVPYTDGLIHKKEPQYITMVLDADMDKKHPMYSPFGFYIKTAYPDDIDGQSPEIGTVSRAEAVKNIAITSMNKAYFIAAGNTNHIQVSLQNKTQSNADQSIRLTKLPINNEKGYTAYINANDTKYYEYGQNNIRHHVSKDQVHDNIFMSLVQNTLDNYFSFEQETLNSYAKKVTGKYLDGLDTLIEQAKEQSDILPNKVQNKDEFQH